MSSAEGLDAGRLGDGGGGALRPGSSPNRLLAAAARSRADISPVPALLWLESATVVTCFCAGRSKMSYNVDDEAA